MRKTMSFLLLIAAVSSLAACNTVHGFGRDVERLGEKVQGK